MKRRFVEILVEHSSGNFENYKNYSGRNMYGKTTHAIVSYLSYEDSLELIEEIVKDRELDNKVYRDCVDSIRSGELQVDRLDSEIILYLPDLF